MAGIPPLRNIRKTTVIVIAVFLSFFVHRFISLWLEDRVVVEDTKTNLSPAQSVVCRNVVRGTPFGVDSVFEEHNRLYFYSTISKVAFNSDDTLRHVWFWGTDTIQSLPCKAHSSAKGSSNYSVCHSEISPRLLKPGEWSVDLVVGHKLLSSKQFLIESANR